MARLQGLFFIALWFVQSSAMDFVCDKDEVKRDWKRCERVYQIHDGNNITILEMCSNIDCLIQCKIDAVGDCAKSDEFLDEMINYDPQKWKVYFRVACSDPTFAIEQSQSQGGCEVNDTLCSSDDLSSKFLQGLLNLYKNGKYEEYKELLCNTTAIARQCIKVTPTENCTESSARVFSDMAKVGSSLSFCDNKDIKHLYTAHGGDLKCENRKLESKCFKSSVMSRVSRCTTLSLTNIVAQQLSPNIDDFCSSPECNLKCYEDAVSQCNLQDQHFYMDPVAVKVSNRAACENKEDLKKAVAVCNMRNMTCYTEFNNSQTEANVLLQQLNYTAHKHTMCRAISKFIDCVDYNVAGDCTDNLATLMKDMVTVTHSYSTCGPQNHTYFSKYGSDTNCVISGSGKPLINVFLFSMTMVILMLLYR